MNKGGLIAWLLVGAYVLAGVSLVGASGSASSVTADKALEMLMEGNKHFVAGNLKHLEHMSASKARHELAKGQHPYAIIVSCSDSRVPPEILFDKGLGEIFVIRVAGNVVAPHELGSIEYAAEHLGSSLVMVLGHERCGAVTAAVDAHGPAEGNIGSIVGCITPAVERARKKNPAAAHADLVESAVSENVKLVAKDIQGQSAVMKKMVAEGKVRIVGAKYDLDDGLVQMIPVDE
jgi:carbonic anhydrase